MKLTTKHIMFILMCTLLVLAVVLGCIVLSKVSGLLQLGGIGAPGPSESSPSASTPESSSVVPPSSSQQETSAPHVHEFVKYKTVSPTCDMQGYSLYSCSCGRGDIQDFTDPLGHKYGAATVVEATCDRDGYTERTCSRCKKVERTNPTAAGHKFSAWTAAETNKQRTCSGCSITEIRSLDDTQTWVLRLSKQEHKGSFNLQKITVDLAESDSDPTCEVYINASIDATGFDYSESGLTVFYMLDGEAKSYLVPTGATVVSIYADGQVTTAAPVETPTPDPDPEPDPNPDPNPDPDPDSDSETN